MKRKILFVILAVSIIATLTMSGAIAVQAAGTGGSDWENHWAAPYMEKAIQRGWINGYPDGTMRPDGPITRAEFAALLWRALDEKAPTSSCPFSDVPISSYYENAVTSLYEAGVVDGVGDGLFAPGKLLTREQGVTMLARAFGLAPENPDTYRDFTDAGDISGWARAAFSALIEKAYVEGVGGGRLVPKQNMKRGEMAKLLVTAFDGENREPQPGTLKITLTRNPSATTTGSVSVTARLTGEGVTYVGWRISAKGAVYTDRTGFTDITAARAFEAVSNGWYAVCAQNEAGQFAFALLEITNISGYSGGGPVRVRGVQLSDAALSLSVGDSRILTAAITPANAGNQGVTWESSDPGVAAVDGGGVVTAISTGKAVITVKTVDGGKTASCTVTVIPKPLRSNFTVADNKKFYNGTAQSASVGYNGGITVTQAGVITVYYAGIWGTVYPESTAAPTNAGEYDIKVTTTGGTDYGAIVTPTTVGNLSINHAILNSIITGMSPSLSPIDNTMEVHVKVNGLAAGDTAVISLDAVPGITFDGTSISYDGTTEFADPNVTLNFSVDAGSNYGTAKGSLKVLLYDGQADYGGSGHDRRIPVNQRNITNFNSYAATLLGRKRHYKLVENITLTTPVAGESNWKNIGSAGINDATRFTGGFDGQNHSISNLTIVSSGTSGSGRGLFSSIGSGGTVKNLRLQNVSIDSVSSVGGVAGSLYGGLVPGVIENCSVSGKVKGSGMYIGGVVGYVGGGTVRGCNTTCDVVSNGGVNASANSQIGGILGYAIGITASVTDCYATGDIDGGQRVGGVAGCIVGGVTMTNCYATGTITGESYLGGVLGTLEAAKMINCYATGDVTGTISLVGGVVGNSSSGTIQTCYATGKIEGYGFLGGIAGNSPSSTIQNCVALVPSITSSGSGLSIGRVTTSTSTRSGNYAFSGMTVTDTGGVVTPTETTGAGKDGADLSAVDARKHSTYIALGWDFTDAWQWSGDADDGRPLLWYE